LQYISPQVKTFHLEDVLSILHSADDNHVNSTYRDLKQICALTDDVKGLMDESINLALINNEFDPLLEIFSSEQNLEIYNYRHSETGVTPLMVFAAKGQLGDVCMLLSFGVDCSSQDHNGKSALDWAQQENQQEICELIRKHMEFSSEKSGKDSELLDKYLATINPEYIDTANRASASKNLCGFH
jgi:ATP-dependent RNA helicase DHX36